MVGEIRLWCRLWTHLFSRMSPPSWATAKPMWWRVSWCHCLYSGLSCVQRHEHPAVRTCWPWKEKTKGSQMLLKDLHLILKTWTTQPFPRLIGNLNPLTKFLTWQPVLGPSILSHWCLRFPAPAIQCRPCTASGPWRPNTWLVDCWVFNFLINRLFRAGLDLD